MRTSQSEARALNKRGGIAARRSTGLAAVPPKRPLSPSQNLQVTLSSAFALRAIGSLEDFISHDERLRIAP
jgi:hypothetical protein